MSRFPSWVWIPPAGSYTSITLAVTLRTYRRPPREQAPCRGGGRARNTAGSPQGQEPLWHSVTWRGIKPRGGCRVAFWLTPIGWSRGPAERALRSRRCRHARAGWLNVVDREAELREHLGESHQVGDEYPDRHAIEPGGRRPAEMDREVASIELLLEESEQGHD